MIFFGSRASKLGEFDVGGTTCGYCGQQNSQHISIYGKYAHIYWIPLFPLGKKAIAECNHCKRTYTQSEFPPSLNLQYNQAKNSIKRPIWHWLGVILIFGFSFLINVFHGLFGDPSDQRKELLQADIEKMVSDPSVESDSISFKLKYYLDNVIIAELHPEEFKYLTKIKENKALILVEIPKLKKVAKSERRKMLRIIEEFANSQADLKGKELYIGIQGQIFMMMIKTPIKEESKNMVSEKPLFEFYGHKPAPPRK